MNCRIKSMRGGQKTSPQSNQMLALSHPLPAPEKISRGLSRIEKRTPPPANPLRQEDEGPTVTAGPLPEAEEFSNQIDGQIPLQFQMDAPCLFPRTGLPIRNHNGYTHELQNQIDARRPKNFAPVKSNACAVSPRVSSGREGTGPVHCSLHRPMPNIPPVHHPLKGDPPHGLVHRTQRRL